MKPLPFRAALPVLDALSGLEQIKEAKHHYRRWQQEGLYQRTPTAQLFLAQLIGPSGKANMGLIGLLPASAYQEELILPHEATLYQGVRRQLDSVSRQRAMTKPILLTHRHSAAIDAALQRALPQADELAVFDLGSCCFSIFALAESSPAAHELQEVYKAINPTLLVADGHHRLACATQLIDRPDAPDHFPALMLADQALHMETFYRLVLPPTDESPDELLHALATDFEIKARKRSFKPSRPGEWCFYLAGKFYRLRRHHTGPDHEIDPIWFNDSILPTYFGITDSRTDERIESQRTGADGRSMSKLVSKYPDHAIFLPYPISREDFFTLVEHHRLLPPKSTCFYPRIPTGMLVYDWDA